MVARGNGHLWMGTTAPTPLIMMLAPGDDARGRFASGIIGT